VVAVGFQEIVPLSAGNALLGPSAEGADAWDFALAATLNGEEWCAGAGQGGRSHLEALHHLCCLALSRPDCHEAPGLLLTSPPPSARRAARNLGRTYGSGADGPYGASIERLGSQVGGRCTPGCGAFPGTGRPPAGR
jgi:hypothetical protein